MVLQGESLDEHKNMRASRRLKDKPEAANSKKIFPHSLINGDGDEMVQELNQEAIELV